MTVADYILATIGLIACIIWCCGSFLVASTDAFTPAPNAESRETSRKGCAALLAGVIAIAWLIGVLWAGSWGWLSW